MVPDIRFGYLDRTINGPHEEFAGHIEVGSHLVGDQEV